jgi:hypothetical protein
MGHAGAWRWGLANFMTTMRQLTPVSFWRNQPIVVITLRVMNPVRHHEERDDYLLLSQNSKS